MSKPWHLQKAEVRVRNGEGLAVNQGGGRGGDGGWSFQHAACRSIRRAPSCLSLTWGCCRMRPQRLSRHRRPCRMAAPSHRTRFDRSQCPRQEQSSVGCTCSLQKNKDNSDGDVFVLCIGTCDGVHEWQPSAAAGGPGRRGAPWVYRPAVPAGCCLPPLARCTVHR